MIVKLTYSVPLVVHVNVSLGTVEDVHTISEDIRWGDPDDATTEDGDTLSRSARAAALKIVQDDDTDWPLWETGF